MKFVKPQLFSEAVQKLGERSPIGSKLSSREWRDVPVALRERAFFSARVESARFLSKAQGHLGDFLTGAVETLPNGKKALKVGGRAQFIERMQKFAIANGMGPLDPKDKGGLKDITSESRLGLIFDISTKAANDFGNWKQGQDPDLLDAFPAQRFIRVQEVHAPRAYHEAALDEVRLKTDLAFWIGLNRDFGVPWGPWGFGSGCDVEDVDRDEAENLKLLKPGERVEPVDRDFNSGLKASLKGLAPATVQRLQQDFGDQVEVRDDTVFWKGQGDVAPAPKPAPEPTPEPEPIPPKPKPEQPTTPSPGNPVPPTPAPTPAPAPQRPPDVASLVKKLGLDSGTPATGKQMTGLMRELRVADPIKATDRVASWDQSALPAKKSPSSALYVELAQDKVLAHAQEFMDLIPREIADTLPPIHWALENDPKRGGSYNWTTQRLTLSTASLKGKPAAEVKRVVWHELMHWLHFHGPAAYRDKIAAHFKARTTLPNGKMEPIMQLPGYGSATKGQRDDWYEVYAGRRYLPPFDFATGGYGMGVEVPTRYVELLLRAPEMLAEMWQKSAQRQTLLVMLEAFFAP